MNTKVIYILILVLSFALIMYDHMTSPVLAIASPGQTENSCAPCGAPCRD
jgi:hypothetical protein